MSEPGIELDHVAFKIGEFALADVCLEVRAGEYFVLTGPNGSGKTLLVKLIAGIHSPDAGEILIKGERVTGTPPWERHIGYVPQEYGLFPNLTVERNIAFGLEVRRIDKPKVTEEVARAAELLGVSHLLHRMPKGLSGGEQQKVSLARALVLKPAVLLLDEPVSAIDEDRRDEICVELKRIQKETRVTTLHVSHNRHEAELVADRTGVLKGGAISLVEKGGIQ